jgi:hypothetical protein
MLFVYQRIFHAVNGAYAAQLSPAIQPFSTTHQHASPVSFRSNGLQARHAGSAKDVSPTLVHAIS